LYYLLNNRLKIKRERKEEKEEKRKRKERRRFWEGKGGDPVGHEVSLVTTATEKMRAHP